MMDTYGFDGWRFERVMLGGMGGGLIPGGRE